MILLSSTFDKHKPRLRLSSLSARLAKFAGFVLACEQQTHFRHTSFFEFPILYFSIEIDQNRSKSIKINHNRTKSIITRNCVIDFYRFPIFVDWFVSTMIDNDRILSTELSTCYVLNYVITIFFFLKMPKIWVGRTTLNGEKKEDALPKATVNEESAFHCWCFSLIYVN